MSSELIIRVAAPLADELVAARLAAPMPSSERSAALELVVHASIVAKDVASVVLAVAAGARGLRAILERLQRSEPGDELVVTVHSSRATRTWTVRGGGLDDATKDEILRSLDAE